MKFLSLLVLLPVLAVGQVRSSDGVPPTGGTFSGSVTADSFTATAGAGSNGYHQSTGAYLDLGDGADDYLYSDGLLVHSAAPVDFPLGINSGGTVTRGMQSIVMSKPVNATFTLGAGTLVAGTYCYRVTASTLAGETDPSTETCLTIGAGDAPAGVNVNWAAIPGAIVYKVYGRTTGIEELLTTIGNIPVATPTWLDSGSGTPSGAMPTKNESGVISSPSFNSTAVAGDVAYRQADDTKMCLDLADTSCLTATTSLITASAPVSMPSLTTTAASGAVGIQGVTGQKWDLGSGASDYFTSDGTNILAAGSLCVSGQTDRCFSNMSGRMHLTSDVALWADIIEGRRASTGGLSLSSYATVTSDLASFTFTGINGAAGALTTGYLIYVKNSTTDTFKLYHDGAIWSAPHAIGTCGDSDNPEGKIVTVPGATTHATKMCLCTYVPTGTTYAWKNISAIFADDATAFGDTTTCPDP
jgi:hypothetical protein